MSKISFQRGFTIVELLIVIVVIGILAAISIVSYNGITERARETVRLSTSKDVRKMMEIYRSRTGVWRPPLSSGNNNGFGAACIGERHHYPATSDFEEGQCVELPRNLFGSISAEQAKIRVDDTYNKALFRNDQVPDGSHSPEVTTLSNGDVIKQRGVIGFSEASGSGSFNVAYFRGFNPPRKLTEETGYKGVCAEGMEYGALDGSFEVIEDTPSLQLTLIICFM